MSDYAMPERAVAPEEQVCSNMMDPTVAAKLLEEAPHDQAAGREHQVNGRDNITGTRMVAKYSTGTSFHATSAW
jgi:hypothetical protein